MSSDSIHSLILVWFPAPSSGWGEKGERKGLVNNLTPLWIYGISLLFNTYKFIAHTLNVKPHVHTTHSHEILFTTHTYLTFAVSPINADGRNAAVDWC